MRRIIVHNHFPAQDYTPNYRNDEFRFSAEVDRGQGRGFEQQHLMAKSPEEAQQKFQSQFGSWSKVRNVKQLANDAETKQFMLRTEYAGVGNSKAHLKKSEAIAKRYKSFKVTWHADKGVGVEMDASEFRSFERDMQAAGIGYLIDD